ncbi:hypothetical protein [Legionella spiritensis]|uniref:hypothetical protein n=1 Tax=Legionella spiritensis TaxID=452 RepID=UPI000F6F3B8A|nr:hypothetical protein [Legionella spiritensis]VEG89834.1 Uncharacterised protein [Legionella spiritensis]
MTDFMEAIKDAAKKYGFDLEYWTKKAFKNVSEDTIVEKRWSHMLGQFGGKDIERNS